MKPLLLVALLLIAACEDSPRQTVASPDTTAPAPVETAAPYRFDRPAASFDLPADLREISGLTWLADGRLAAVQDERGTVFFLDPATGRVDATFDFGKKGDYESVEAVGDRLFVLRADGTLFDLEGWQGEAPHATEIDTGLKKSCDAEGLAYQPDHRRLLLACKERADKDLKGLKALFAFDLDTRVLHAEPVYTLDGGSGRDEFKPSALAVDPRTGDVLVLSSVRKAIVVFGADGRRKAEWDLTPAGFEQPEGLAVSPQGDLFIASEGTAGPGLLRRYRPTGGS